MNHFKQIQHDVPAGLVVFFVSVPLCLGIALASGAPLMSGLVAGVLGGVLGGLFSKSPFSVAGPAAGLASVALFSISELGSFQLFLLAVVLAGVIQIILGLLRAGSIGRFFPVSVIKGMLAGIGLILVFKQIPHALGYDLNFEGDEAFFQPDKENTFSEIIRAIQNITPGALLISILSLIILLVWVSRIWKSNRWIRLIPGPLVVVLVSVLVNRWMLFAFPELGLAAEHLVNLPVLQWATLPGEEVLFSLDTTLVTKLLLVAVTVAVVASLETVLNVEAIDKLDPYRRTTPLNRELIAQGATNIASGLLGGLPVTSVIARSSVNINAGARTRLSTITQGLLLALSVWLFPGILKMIPLASLAVILIVTGYRLTPLSLWETMYRKGLDQFIPFAVTALVILFSNLLTGMMVGLVIALVFVLKSNFRLSILKVNRDGQYLVKFTRDVTFLNKALLHRILVQIPDGAHVYIDGTRSQFIDKDIIEMVEDFQKSAPLKKISVEIVKKNYAVHPFFKHEEPT